MMEVGLISQLIEQCRAIVPRSWVQIPLKAWPRGTFEIPGAAGGGGVGGAKFLNGSQKCGGRGERVGRKQHRREKKWGGGGAV